MAHKAEPKVFDNVVEEDAALEQMGYQQGMLLSLTLTERSPLN